MLLAVRLPAQTFTVEQKAVFNKEETLKLVTAGTSVIQGQLFARDNENEGVLKGTAVLNIQEAVRHRGEACFDTSPQTGHDFFAKFPLFSLPL